MTETFAVTQCIYGLKSKTFFFKTMAAWHEQALVACCWTKRVTEHTPALHQSISTVTGILTSTSTTSVHEPEKVWGALACKCLLWNKRKIPFNIRLNYSKCFSIISALILDVDQGYFFHFGSGMDFWCQNVWVDGLGKIGSCCSRKEKLILLLAVSMLQGLLWLSFCLDP